MGLLRFSRKEKPSSSKSSSSTLSCRRIEIPSKAPSFPAKDDPPPEPLNRDFISNSAFRAIIGEKGSLLDDILNELRPEDTDSRVDPFMPRSSSSTATSSELRRPTPTITKSAALPNGSRQSHQGFLAQKYMEANNRRQRNPGSSNNRVTSVARPDAWTVDQKRNKAQTMYAAQSDTLPPQQQHQPSVSCQSRSVLRHHHHHHHHHHNQQTAVPVINEPSFTPKSTRIEQQQRRQQTMHGCGTSKCDLLHPGITLQAHLPPSPPPDAEEEDDLVDAARCRRRGEDKATMTADRPCNHNHHHKCTPHSHTHHYHHHTPCPTDHHQGNDYRHYSDHHHHNNEYPHHRNNEYHHPSYPHYHYQYHQYHHHHQYHQHHHPHHHNHQCHRHLHHQYTPSPCFCCCSTTTSMPLYTPPVTHSCHGHYTHHHHHHGQCRQDIRRSSSATVLPSAASAGQKGKDRVHADAGHHCCGVQVARGQ